MTRSMQGRTRWSAHTTTDEAHARAAGRRRYNAVRRLHAGLRRAQLLKLAAAYGGLHYGIQARLARDLGVSEATISRDLNGILAHGERPRCPLCGCGGHLDTSQQQNPDPLDALTPPVDLDALEGLNDRLLDSLDTLEGISRELLDDLDDQEEPHEMARNHDHPAVDGGTVNYQIEGVSLDQL